MTETDFSIADLSSARVMHVGGEKQPVIVIDDFVRSPRALVEFAATRVQFGGPLTHYPGPIAPLPTQYAVNVVRATSLLIRQAFGFGAGGVKVECCYYGLATLRPEQLNIRQRHPHTDATNPNQLAVLHYLCDASQGGTTFYRHRETGYETMDAGQYAQYTQLVQKDMDEHGVVPPQYIRGDNRLYEQTGAVEARFNRAVIYRGNLLHSATIGEAATFSPDPRAGRLTANTFLVFPVAPAQA